MTWTTFVDAVDVAYHLGMLVMAFKFYVLFRDGIPEGEHPAEEKSL